MAPLGPFGAAPRIAAGVSGGPHSLALALLADGWARARGGDLLALVADHGLRPDSGAEAEGVAALLAARGIAARVLRLGLPGGPGLQARARAARFAALAEAAAEDGRPWLLLGHHRADQAETVLFRALRGSGPEGLAGMAAVRDAGRVLVLRPLLGVAPARLEAVLVAAGVPPVRDPSNCDPRFTRVRLRQALGDPEGEGPGIAAVAKAAGAFAARRARIDAAVAERLALAAEIRPEGFAAIDPALLGTDAVARAALGRLIAMVGGGGFRPAADAVAALMARGGGTLGGAWLRDGAGGRWLLLRDPGTIGPEVPAVRGAAWDGRYRMTGPGRAGWRLGALGTVPAGLRGAHGLPDAVLRALPAVRDPHGALAAVPLLDYPSFADCVPFAVAFAPGAGAGAAFSG
ncbi:tRNA lysidine(34) synthetase TilS [Neoroseomonas oryzicola]|uniref:tRNA(Ile)-lysidine synthase n=1 Tax=Neoroseomonas oryzicola TaxID=535904 RepID=A0A9X9WPK0_9PROT|nr:tRNA lysidine(34) synthetase TilS [Neoroseomonas oryzicola]MBR0662260.1 tRNA lysidine(34) synthetase TilS [Neoroseomonas oryzicola]NKE18426.1 tRNA lysidine(34) synthetase TilS [Neoroseomonas oryzicola]